MAIFNSFLYVYQRVCFLLAEFRPKTPWVTSAKTSVASCGPRCAACLPNGCRLPLEAMKNLDALESPILEIYIAIPYSYSYLHCSYCSFCDPFSIPLTIHHTCCIPSWGCSSTKCVFYPLIGPTISH